MKLIKWLLTAVLMLTPSLGVAQSFFTDRAVGVSQFNGFTGLVPIAYGPVRVCTIPIVVASPCTPVAAIQDTNGAPLSINGGNFGQLTTDIVGRFSFKAAPGDYLIQVAATGSNTPQLNYPISIGLGSATNIQNLNNILFADTFSGANCGLKIAAADTQLGANPGEIWFSRSCGTSQWNNVSLSAAHVLKNIQGGIFNTGSITFANGSALIAPDTAMYDGVTSYTPLTLKPNTATGLIVSGKQVTLKGFFLNGSSASGAGIVITASRANLDNVVVTGFPSDGIQLTSTGTNNEAGEAKLFRVMSIANGGFGLKCTNTADGFVSFSEFENAPVGKVGMDMTACGAWRVNNNDFGGNVGGGVALRGLATSAILNGSFSMFTVNNFGNNAGPDISINCWDASAGAPSITSMTLSLNTFAGLGSTAADNTHDAIGLTDCSGISVLGNPISSIAAHRYRYGIRSTNSASAAGANAVIGNPVNGLVGTAALNLKANEIAVCNVEYATGFCLLQNVYFNNNTTISVKNAAGTTQSIWTPLNNVNGSVWNNTNVGGFFDWQVNGTSNLKVEATKATVLGLVVNGSQTMNGVSGNGASILTNNQPSVTGMQFPKTDITLVNGANADIALSGTTFARIVGPTAVFSVSGFAAPANGRVLYLFNSTNFAMTITNNAASTAGNRIITLTGADVVLRAGPSCATFIYDSGLTVWVLASTN